MCGCICKLTSIALINAHKCFSSQKKKKKSQIIYSKSCTAQITFMVTMRGSLLFKR